MNKRRQIEELSIKYEFVEDAGAEARLQKTVGFLVKKLEEKRIRQEKELNERLGLSDSIYKVKIRKAEDNLFIVLDL